MTRSEFLAKLKEALENDLSGKIVQENVSYYDSYISEEMSKGRAESEIIKELGDPWILARSIIGMADEQAEETQEVKNGRKKTQSAGEEKSAAFISGIDTWWKKLLFYLGVIGIVILIVTVVVGVMHVLAALLVPIMLVVLVVWLVKGFR